MDTKFELIEEKINDIKSCLSKYAKNTKDIKDKTESISKELSDIKAYLNGQLAA